jgi:hypothetical protein
MDFLRNYQNVNVFKIIAQREWRLGSLKIEVTRRLIRTRFEERYIYKKGGLCVKRIFPRQNSLDSPLLEEKMFRIYV